MAAELAGVKAAAAQVQATREAQRQGLQAALGAAEQQLVLEQRRTADLSARLSDLERLAEAAADTHIQTVARLQANLGLAEQKRADGDALRLAAEATAQVQRRAAEEAVAGRDAERRRSAQLTAELASLRAAAETDRDDWQRKLFAAEARATTLLESTNALQACLVESDRALQAELGGRDRIRRAIAEARAATSQLGDPARLEKVEAELAATREQLSERTRERDKFLQAAARLLQTFEATTKKLAAAEADLANKNALIAELGPKLTRAYDQLLRIKEHKDWRL